MRRTAARRRTSPTRSADAVRRDADGGVDRPHRSDRAEQRRTMCPDLPRREDQQTEVQQEEHVRGLVNRIGQVIRRHRVMADPTGDSPEAPHSSQIGGEGGTDRQAVRRDQGTDELGRGEQRGHLSKGTQRRAQPQRRHVPHDRVGDDPQNHRHERRRPHDGQHQGDRHDEPQNREHHVSPSGLEYAGLREPPHLAGMPAQAGQRHLDPLPRGGILRESGHQRFERGKIVPGGSRSQPVIEQLLADVAFRPVENREHGVEVQVLPRTCIERDLAVHREDPVIVRDLREVPRPFRRASPLGAQALQELSAATARQQVETRQNDDDQSDGQPQRHAVGTIPGLDRMPGRRLAARRAWPGISSGRRSTVVSRLRAPPGRRYA